MDEKTYSLKEAHEHFAKSINGRVWELLQMSDRTPLENDEMLYAAHACTYHWKFAGTVVHQQRGEWLISRVYLVLGNLTEAFHHAERCHALTGSNREAMADFDIAYDYEGLARVHAAAGNLVEAKEFLRLAREAGDVIADEEDQSIFMGDFNSGNWFGAR
jgi:tetratricopeptide (TPR) repeat protein